MLRIDVTYCSHDSFIGSRAAPRPSFALSTKARFISFASLKSDDNNYISNNNNKENKPLLAVRLYIRHLFCAWNPLSEFPQFSSHNRSFFFFFLFRIYFVYSLSAIRATFFVQTVQPFWALRAVCASFSLCTLRWCANALVLYFFYQAVRLVFDYLRLSSNARVSSSFYIYKKRSKGGKLYKSLLRLLITCGWKGQYNRY